MDCTPSRASRPPPLALVPACMMACLKGMAQASSISGRPASLLFGSWLSAQHHLTRRYLARSPRESQRGESSPRLRPLHSITITLPCSSFANHEQISHSDKAFHLRSTQFRDHLSRTSIPCKDTLKVSSRTKGHRIAPFLNLPCCNNACLSGSQKRARERCVYPPSLSSLDACLSREPWTYSIEY
jgi:hypothetical protein